MKEDKYIKEAKQYVEKNFGGNYGNVDKFWCPTNHKEAITFLKHFIEKDLIILVHIKILWFREKTLCFILV